MSTIVNRRLTGHRLAIPDDSVHGKPGERPLPGNIFPRKGVSWP